MSCTEVHTIGPNHRKVPRNSITANKKVNAANNIPMHKGANIICATQTSPELINHIREEK